MTNRTVRRFSYLERIVHWSVGVSFVLLLATGLAFAYPSLYWITAVVGGGAAARVLHPWIGVLFGGALVAMFLVWVRDMFLGDADARWLTSVHHYAAHRTNQVPPVGKYNAGQKLFFWLQSGLGAALIVSGVPLWFPAGLVRIGPIDPMLLNAMRLAHYGCGLVAGLLLIPHVYLGTIALPGTIRGMIDGQVTRRWASHHHPLWEREKTKS